MLPAPRSLLHACAGRWRSLGWLVAASALIALAGVDRADAQEAPDNSERSLPNPDIDRETPIAFEADRVEYRFEAEDTVIASGNVRMVDQDGNQLFTQRVELTDELKTGAMESLLLALREGGRLAAAKGERTADGKILLTRAAYTGCEVEDRDGCPKKPSWRVTAGKVIYDPAAKRVRFKGARLEMLGFVQLPLPGLISAPTGGRAPGSSSRTCGRRRRTESRSPRPSTGGWPTTAT